MTGNAGFIIIFLDYVIANGTWRGQSYFRDQRIVRYNFNQFFFCQQNECTQVIFP